MGEIVSLNVSETSRPIPRELEAESFTPTIDLCNEVVDTVRRMNAYDDLSSEEPQLGEKDALQAANARQHVLLARATALSQILSGRIARTGNEIAGKTQAYVALAGLPLEDPELVHLLAVSIGRDGQVLAAGGRHDEPLDHHDTNWSSQRNRFIYKPNKEE